VLFDSRATHSFVSYVCMRELILSVKEFQYDLSVLTPISSVVSMCFVCAKCVMIIYVHMFKINLIYLPRSRYNLRNGLVMCSLRYYRL